MRKVFGSPEYPVCSASGRKIDTAETPGQGAPHEYVIHRGGTFNRAGGISDAGGLLNVVFTEDVDGSPDQTFLDAEPQA